MADYPAWQVASRVHTLTAPAALPHQSRGADQLTARLRQAILSGQYTFSERLPSERELAKHFGTSRGTVRKAIARLADMHLVDRKIGSGTFVLYGEFADRIDIANVTSPLELIEVRVGIEVQIARLSVANATVVDFERISSALEQLEDCNDPESFTQADSHFHLALAESTHNRLLVWLYQLLNEVRNHAQWRAMKDQILTVERIERYNLQHRQLLSVIMNRDVDGAVDTIQRHLDQARKDLHGLSD